MTSSSITREMEFRTAFASWTDAELYGLVNALTRRRFVVTATSIAVLAGLPGITHGQTPAASPAGTTRMVDTVNGMIEVPLNPTRIVCIDSYSITALVDAGMIPIGIPELDLDGFISAYKDALTGVPTVGTFQEIDVEQIKVLNPEVILAIAAPWATEIYEQLRTIAPTVVLDYDVSNAWQVLADQFTYAVGREGKLSDVKQHYAERAEGVKATHAETLATLKWAVAIGWGAADNQWTLYYPDSAPGVVLELCGVEFIEAVRGKTGGNEAFSYERLSLLKDADVLLTYGVRDGAPVEDSVTMIDQPLFQALKVAQTDTIYALANVVPSSYGSAIEFIGSVEEILLELGAAATPAS